MVSFGRNWFVKLVKLYKEGRKKMYYRTIIFLFNKTLWGNFYVSYTRDLRVNQDFCFCKSHILERRRKKKWNERKTDELTDSGRSKCASMFVLCGPL